MASRKICPKCKSVKLKQYEDRTKVIYSSEMPIYKKAWRCGDCGEKFE